MNKLLITLTASLFWVAAFGQGKLQFANDTSHLIYFSPDTAKLAPADATKWVNGYPLAGSGAYTGSGSTIAALAGSPSFVAALYGGASPCALVLLTTTTIDDINNEGAVVPVNLVLNGFQAGAPIWLQVQVYDSRSANATDAWDWGRYAGVSQIFQATPQPFIYAPMYLPQYPTYSTWAPGTFELVDYPGAYGAIELSTYYGPNPLRPLIYSQPANATNYLGHSVTFSVSACGGAVLHYQWQANGADLSDGPNISGSRTNQLTLNAITVADAASYRVVITNYYGSVTSTPAGLTLVGAPGITEQPMSQVGYWGKSVTFAVTATGDPLPSYQWKKDDAGILGATGTSLVLTNLQATNAGRYTVVVANAVRSITSSNAYLTVNPAGVSLALYSGITVDGVVGFTYGIQYSTDLSNTNDWLGVTNLTLSVPTQLWLEEQPANQQQRYYRVVPGPIPIP